MIATIDIVEACKDVNIVVMLGRFPRKEGMERMDMMSKMCLCTWLKLRPWASMLLRIAR